MADGHHFDVVKAPYLNQKLSDFDEIWCAEANSNKLKMAVIPPKFKIFKIQDGGRLLFSK